MLISTDVEINEILFFFNLIEIDKGVTRMFRSNLPLWRKHKTLTLLSPLFSPASAIIRISRHWSVSFRLRSDRKSKNCATFYFRHLDTDSEQNEDGAIVMEDSSEEDWTYTSSRLNITSEQRNTNVLVRLDFREGQSESRETAEVDGKTSERKPVKESSSSMEVVDESNETTDASSCNKKDSDDETSNDKTSIQRLIKEVEKLVREERRNGASKTFPQFIFDDKKGLTNNHRAKYARIKEWLKLNSARGHDGHSTSQVGCNYHYYICMYV